MLCTEEVQGAMAFGCVLTWLLARFCCAGPGFEGEPEISLRAVLAFIELLVRSVNRNARPCRGHLWARS
jgi:hypothetical protein